jgi:hypothetical protein
VRRGRGGLAVTGQLVFRRVELVSVSVAVGTIRREFWRTEAPRILWYPPRVWLSAWFSSADQSDQDIAKLPSGNSREASSSTRT